MIWVKIIWVQFYQNQNQQTKNPTKIERAIYKNDLMMCDWFILVVIKFLKSLYLCICLSILNSFSWETKLPVVLLSMLLSKPSSSVYK